MESKKRGWWALAGVIAASVALLLGGYVGAYYCTVQPFPKLSPEIDNTVVTGADLVDVTWDIRDSYWIGFGGTGFWQWFFWPIHQVDRRLRPQAWSEWPLPPSLPAVSHPTPSGSPP